MGREWQASVISPPLTGEVFVAAATIVPASLDLDAEVTPTGGAKITGYWRERILTVQADGAAIYVAFCRDPAEVAALSTTATSASSAAPGTTTTIKIPVDTEKSFRTNGRQHLWRYLAFRTAAGAGTVRIWASSPKG